MPDLNHPWFVAMRRWNDKAISHYERHVKLRPPHGTIGVGSADMDEWFKAYAISEFLSALRKGGNPQQAADHANGEMKLAVQKWNTRGCRAAINSKHELHYWTEHGSDLVQSMLIEFSQIKPPAKRTMAVVKADGTMGLA